MKEMVDNVIGNNKKITDEAKKSLVSILDYNTVPNPVSRLDEKSKEDLIKAILDISKVSPGSPPDETA